MSSGIFGLNVSDGVDSVTSMRQFSYIVWGLILVGFSSLSFAAPIRIHADIFEIDGQTEKVHAKGRVNVTKEDVQIQSQELTYTHANQHIAFNKQVVLEKGPIRLSSERLEGYQNADNIHAYGHVSFVYNDITGESDQAAYSINKELLVLSGHSQAKQGLDKVTGDKIVIDVRRQKLVTQGRAKIKISPESTSL